MKFFSENHSGDVNIHSGRTKILHPFWPGIHIHIASESLFTSLRNDYSHAPESALVCRIPLDPSRYPLAERRAVFATQLIERLKNAPAVKSAALNTGYHPFGNAAVPIVVPGITDARPATIPFR
ncbi:MAG TPA: hypothetical protein VMZ30_20930 [Pyrinomonadaceae bacterium]|nr:hypothetical protein [Pyrinomonadaceae bacterium]